LFIFIIIIIIIIIKNHHRPVQKNELHHRTITVKFLKRTSSTPRRHLIQLHHRNVAINKTPSPPRIRKILLSVNKKILVKVKINMLHSTIMVKRMLPCN